RSPGVQLTPDAQETLMNYSWPGNVRQLKNIAEQIAVLEKERIVNATILSKYLPVEQPVSSLPVFVKDAGKEDFSERDLLYKVLFDMEKDMVDLKKLVVELLKEGVTPGTYEQNSPYINQLYNEVMPSAPPTLTIHNPNQGSKGNDYMSYDAQDA